ncbi:unannotated protein [freshwater metagenome]|uniref:Unannotated protein n=1 Tax=freshwater metagenome TaxID=449393 RepID=A0A6J7DJQ2_9ZZZZ
MLIDVDLNGASLVQPARGVLDEVDSCPLLTIPTFGD